MNRRKLVLVVLLCGLAAALVYSFLKMPRETRARKPQPAAGPPAAAPLRKTAEQATEKRVRLDLLERGSRSTGYRRNIFASVRKGSAGKDAGKLLLPPPPPPPPPPLPQTQKSVVPEVPVAPTPPPPPPRRPWRSSSSWASWKKVGTRPSSCPRTRT